MIRRLRSFHSTQMTVVYCPRTRHFFNMSRIRSRKCCRKACGSRLELTQEPVTLILIFGGKRSSCGSVDIDLEPQVVLQMAT
jgi:hypothetical protein